VRDEDLRTLEREALASGASGEARIRYADALERMGRAADAIEVLWPAIESAEVRERLAGWPAAIHDWFVGGSCVSEPSVCPSVAPRCVFAARTEIHHAWGHTPFVNAVGIVEIVGEDALIFDPTSGRARGRIEGLMPLGVTRDVVICWMRHPEPALVGCDIWDGRRLWRLGVDLDPRYVRFSLMPGGVALWESTSRIDAPAKAFIQNLPDPRSGSLPNQIPIAGAPVHGWIQDVHGTKAFVVTHTFARAGAATVVTRREGGEVMHRAPGHITADDHGWIDHGTSEVTSFDATGTRLWSQSMSSFPLLAPRLVISRAERALILVDRFSGHERRLELDAFSSIVAAGSDFVLACPNDTRTLVAANLDGEILWRRSLDDVLQPTADDRVTALVPYARSIFGLTASGTLFRLAP
jgi:hypothetical protein